VKILSPLSSFSGDPRSGLVHIFPAGRLLFGGFAFLGGFRGPMFFQFPLVLIFHGNSMTQSQGQRREA
jgi:hypothetical protein